MTWPDGVVRWWRTLGLVCLLKAGPGGLVDGLGASGKEESGGLEP